MSFVEYLGELIGFENACPEMQLVIAGCMAVVCVRLIAGVVVDWFQRIF